MIYLQNPNKDKFPVNNQTIRLQITVLKVEYLKIRHINPVLAEGDMEFYHSLSPVQELLGEITRLERLAMRLKARDTNNATTTTTSTPTPTAD